MKNNASQGCLCVDYLEALSRSKRFWGSWNLVDLEIRNSIILGLRDSGTGGLGNLGSGGLRD